MEATGPKRHQRLLVLHTEQWKTSGAWRNTLNKCSSFLFLISSALQYLLKKKQNLKRPEVNVYPQFLPFFSSSKIQESLYFSRFLLEINEKKESHPKTSSQTFRSLELAKALFISKIWESIYIHYYHGQDSGNKNADRQKKKSQETQENFSERVSGSLKIN